MEGETGNPEQENDKSSPQKRLDEKSSEASTPGPRPARAGPVAKTSFSFDLIYGEYPRATKQCRSSLFAYQAPQNDGRACGRHIFRLASNSQSHSTPAMFKFLEEVNEWSNHNGEVLMGKFRIVISTIL